MEKLANNSKADKLYTELLRDVNRGNCFLLMPQCYKILSEKQVDNLYIIMEKTFKKHGKI